MSQDNVRKAPTSGASGSTCGATGLYKATDGKITSILLIKRGDPFPNFVGSTGTTRTTWNPVTESSDGNRASFQAVGVAAGTL